MHINTLIAKRKDHEVLVELAITAEIYKKVKSILPTVNKLRLTGGIKLIPEYEPGQGLVGIVMERLSVKGSKPASTETLDKLVREKEKPGTFRANKDYWWHTAHQSKENTTDILLNLIPYLSTEFEIEFRLDHIEKDLLVPVEENLKSHGITL